MDEEEGDKKKELRCVRYIYQLHTRNVLQIFMDLKKTFLKK